MNEITLFLQDIMYILRMKEETELSLKSIEKKLKADENLRISLEAEANKTLASKRLELLQTFLKTI